MKSNHTLITLLSTTLVTTIAFAAEPTVSDAVMRASTPVCDSPVVFKRAPLTGGVPMGFRAELINAESEAYGCKGSYAAYVSNSGWYYIGQPWILSGFEGTIEKRIRNFAWERMRETFVATVDAKPGKNGLLATVANQKTEYGSWAMSGWTDPSGLVFFPGDFLLKGDDPGKARLLRLDKVLSTAPTRGATMARVHVVEFSDFQCPSCRSSATFMKPILEKYADRIRYTRVDVPLMNNHPWAFPAALAGRAIYRQNRDLFWKFKDEVYENQGTLTAFTVGDFAKGFAADHDLDLKKYSTDVDSQALRDEILAGLGAAFSSGVMGTPTFLVDGVIVDAGTEGKTIDGYLSRKLGAK